MTYQIESEDFDFGDPDDQINDTCEKCGRWYDEIGREYQYCRACGWDADKQKWEKPIEPTKDDFESGDADILTGRWY